MYCSGYIARIQRCTNNRDGQFSTAFRRIEIAISCKEICLNARSGAISTRYDAINVTMEAAQNEIFNLQLFSVSTLDHGYFADATKSVLRIWNVDPLKSTILLVQQLTRQTSAPLWQMQVSVGRGAWQVSGVRWRCAVESGKCQVSGGGVQCKRTCK